MDDCIVTDADQVQSRLFDCLERNVVVTSCDGATTSGLLYCIDPESNTAVIVDPSSDSKHLTFVPFESISNVEADVTGNHNPVDLPSWLKSRLEPATSVCSAEDAEARKSKLIQLLVARRIPYKLDDENGRFNLLGVASIDPPYQSNDCLCDNAIVLQRVCEIINEI